LERKEMSIVTKGLGGASLITQGYGFLEWIKKVIKKIISRIIPRRRKRFKMIIPVRGDLVKPFKEEIIVKGVKDFRPILFILLDEDEDKLSVEELKEQIDFLERLDKDE